MRLCLLRWQNESLFPTFCVFGHLCNGFSLNERILLANFLQGSRSTFSCVSFPSFFAFQEGMWDTQISALSSSPTVSGRIVRVCGCRDDGVVELIGRIWYKGGGYPWMIGTCAIVVEGRYARRTARSGARDTR